MIHLKIIPKRQEADRKAKAKGFEGIDHFEGFLYANGLYNEMRGGYDVDVLNMQLIGEEVTQYLSKSIRYVTKTNGKKEEFNPENFVNGQSLLLVN